MSLDGKTDDPGLPKDLEDGEDSAANTNWRLDYVAAGGNRHPAAADWDPRTALVAYAAHNNIALWRPLGDNKTCGQIDHRGVQELLQGHTDTVNAVLFHDYGGGNTNENEPVVDTVILFSGSVDQTVRVWRQRFEAPRFHEIAKLEGHTGSINAISAVTVPHHEVSSYADVILASASADGTIRLWRVAFSGASTEVECIQVVETRPVFLPLALSLGRLDDVGGLFLAAAGTKGTIQLSAADEHEELKQQATLVGHDGWIRSLAIAPEHEGLGSDLMLASASQDKYVRLWRMHFTEQGAPNGTMKPEENRKRKIQPLKSKVQRVENSHAAAAVTFEALLMGHEDWVFTVSWRRSHGKLRLLSASADNSLAIWERDETSGIWLCSTRLGEISAQKGSTTATGSTGGFWSGLWAPDGESVLSLGRTGSWRHWQLEKGTYRWIPNIGTSGHTASITSISWARDGSYLLSTSSDQTTRLHAEWKREGTLMSWHEIARPQIHGYDLNCIDTITTSQFISGADEKCLRVFDQPRATAELLMKLSKTDALLKDDMPDTAGIPVLGLSNKAVEHSQQMSNDITGIEGEAHDDETAHQPKSPNHASQHLDQPPAEDLLARHTLWPEREKLYGHGFEICTVAASHDGKLVATACRASSIDHAMIRLYDTKEWREIKPPLQAHSLTVTCMTFSPDDRHLLSVGRDRQWVLWEIEELGAKMYVLRKQNQKGHTRMILDASWAPEGMGRVFFTAGRDKCVKFWRVEGQTVDLVHTIQASSAVTAVDVVRTVGDRAGFLAYGLESGDVFIHDLTGDGQVGARIALQQRYVVWSKSFFDTANPST